MSVLRLSLVAVLSLAVKVGAGGGPGPIPLLLTVGPATDDACEYQSLQNAINFAEAQGPELDFIRVHKDYSPADAHLLVDDHSVTIEGGFDTCGSSTRSGRTVLDGSGGVAQSVVEILATSSSPKRQVTLRGLEIRGGEPDGGGSGGGIDIYAGPAASLDVTLADVVVEENESTLGGGVAVNGAGADSMELTIEDGSRISSNTATTGGGLYCIGAAVRFEDGLIGPGNEATLGGGVFVDQGGTLLVEAGGLLQGIQLNEATSDGGGIFAQAGSSITLFGSASHSADLVSNQAGGSGGGVFLTGSTTVLQSLAGNISSNSAGGDGGGIYVTDGAGLAMQRGSSERCGDRVRCSRLSGNSAVGLGGGIYVGGGALANVTQTYVEENGGVGQVGYVVDSESFLLLEDAVVAGHVGGNLVQTGLGAALTITHSTITANPSNTWIVLLGDQSTVKLYNSIFWEDQGTVLAVGGQADVDASCLLAHETGSLPPGSVVRTGDPLFVDPGAEDYHLSFLSPALDTCLHAPFAKLSSDVDGEPRPRDLPGVPEASPGSTFDIGADELNPAVVPIFADGFESGDTSNWV